MEDYKLTRHDVDVIMSALGELPLKVSGPTFSRIQAQLLEKEKLAREIREPQKPDYPTS